MDDYLQRLYRNAAGEGHVALWTKQTGRVDWFATTDLAAAAQHMLEVSRTHDIFFGWCLQPAPIGKSRGKSETALYSPGVMFDCDLFSEDPSVHKERSLPKSLPEVEEWIVEAKIRPPSMIRSSGNGLYLDWLHPDPVFFRTEKERSSYAGRVKRFHQFLRDSAKRLRGWNLDNTSDLARVTRMPGTSNHKTNPPKTVAVLK